MTPIDFIKSIQNCINLGQLKVFTKQVFTETTDRSHKKILVTESKPTHLPETMYKLMSK